MLLLPATSEAGGRALVARIQESCSTPLSAGVAEHTGGDSDLDLVAWFGEADADLYRRREAKRRTPVRAGVGMPAAALVGLVTVAASTVGFFGAGNVATSLGLRHGPTAVTGLSAVPQLPAGSEPRPSHGITAAPAHVATARPAPVVRHAVPRVVVHHARELPGALPTAVPTLPPVAVPTALPTAVPTENPTPAPAQTPKPGLVGGLLNTVGNVVSGVVDVVA